MNRRVWMAAAAGVIVGAVALGVTATGEASQAPQEVTVANTPLPVSGTVSANQSGTWNVNASQSGPWTVSTAPPQPTINSLFIPFPDDSNSGIAVSTAALPAGAIIQTVGVVCSVVTAGAGVLFKVDVSNGSGVAGAGVPVPLVATGMPNEVAGTLTGLQLPQPATAEPLWFVIGRTATEGNCNVTYAFVAP